MGDVVIAANLKKKTDMININGDYIDPVTKQVIRKAEETYTPTPDEVSRAMNAKPSTPPDTQPTPPSNSLGGRLEDMIQKKIDERLEKAIDTALDNVFKKLL